MAKRKASGRISNYSIFDSRGFHDSSIEDSTEGSNEIDSQLEFDTCTATDDSQFSHIDEDSVLATSPSSHNNSASHTHKTTNKVELPADWELKYRVEREKIFQ